MKVSELKEHLLVKYTHQVVTSKATMMSSLRMRAVNEIETILRNSFSKSTRDMIMMAPPGKDSISVLWRRFTKSSKPWYTLIKSQVKKVL